MSNNIKGITVVIGGDTSPLNKALDGVDQKSRSLQAELKKVEKALKLDPNNTELLKQKQDLLTKSVSATKEKLDTLRKAQENVNKAHEANAQWEKEYAPIKKEIDATKSKLKSLTEQQKEMQEKFAQGKISTVQFEKYQKELESTKTKSKELAQQERELEKQFKDGHIDDKQYREFQRTVVETEEKLKSLKKQAAESNVTLSKISQGAGKVADTAGHVADKMMPATLAVAGAGAAAVKMGADYEDSLAKVSTIADTSKKSIEALSGEVMSLSNKTGTSADEINEALYQAISAGADTAKATGLVEVAVKSAKGGFTDTATAVDGLTSVLNTYSMKTEDADKLANQFLITQNLGKTTFGELAQSIGKVAPTAQAAGVQTDELLASIAGLTANGINTAESVTGMKAALSNIIKPGKDASDMAKSLGLDFSATALQTKGLGGFMAELKKKTGGNLDTMSKLFGSTEALNTALTLTSESGANIYNKTMQEMKTNTTAVDDAFNKINGTTSNSLKKSLNELKNQAIEIAKMIMPTVNKIIAKISEIARKFAEISPAGKQMILTILLIIAAIAPVAKIVQGIALAVHAVTIAQEALNVAAAANPIGLIILAIAAIIAGLIALTIGIKHLWDTNEGFRTAVTNIWNGIKTTIGGVVNAIVGFFTVTIPNAWNGLVAFFTGIPEWWNNLWTQVGQFFTDCWNGIILFFTTTIPAWIQSVGDWFNQLPYMIGEAIGAVLAGIVNFGVNAWNWVTTELPKIIMGIVDWFGQLPGKIWAFLVDIVTKIGQWGANIWTQAKIVVPKFINTVTTFFGELPGKIWNFLVDVVAKVIEWARNLVTTAQTEIPKFVSSVLGFIGELPGKMLDIGGNIVKGIWDGINGAVSWLHDKISGFCSGIVDGFKKNLQIHSPSRLFADVIGKNLALGIGVGFADNMKTVVASMIDAIPTSFDTGVQVNTAMSAAHGASAASASRAKSTQRSALQSSSAPVINQVNNNYSPKALNHSEIARQTRNNTRQAILVLQRG